MLRDAWRSRCPIYLGGYQSNITVAHIRALTSYLFLIKSVLVKFHATGGESYAGEMTGGRSDHQCIIHSKSLGDRVPFIRPLLLLDAPSHNLIICDGTHSWYTRTCLRAETDLTGLWDATVPPFL